MADSKPAGNRPHVSTPTKGDSPSVTSDPTQSQWAQRNMPVPPVPPVPTPTPQPKPDGGKSA